MYRSPLDEISLFVHSRVCNAFTFRDEKAETVIRKAVCADLPNGAAVEVEDLDSNCAKWLRNFNTLNVTNLLLNSLNSST